MNRLLPVLLVFLALPAQGQPKVTNKGVAINSAVFGHRDAFVELRNDTAETVDMSGWTLGEKKPGAKKAAWQFPAGTALEAGASLVVAVEADAYFRLHNKQPDFEAFDADRGDGALAVNDNTEVPNLILVGGTAGDDRIGLETAVGALQLRNAEGGLRMSLPYGADDEPMGVTVEDPPDEKAHGSLGAANAGGQTEATAQPVDAAASSESVDGGTDGPGNEDLPWPWIGLGAALLAAILMLGGRRSS
jgi:hypothetical protein